MNETSSIPIVRARVAFALAVCTLAACSHASPDDRLAAIASWTATGDMVERRWLDGAVPTSYAHRTLRAAAEEVARAGGHLAGRGAVSDRAAAVLQQMATAVQRGDRGGAPRLIDALTDARRAIDSLRVRSESAR